ncbi:putative nuclease HARBI1 [Ostrea edulis]|uniref:putative nuclease HARBI1 n=1 Tax=Ostrea edulis TaxID=37623 RepID=UPI0024AEC256|nr:putative nuclease HARBI1 [Ostrea edulis]
MTAAELQHRFRFDQEGIEFITDLIQNDIMPLTNRNHSVPAIVQVMVALRYYATGKMQLCSGDNFGLHQSTVSRIIQRVTTALVQPNIVKRFVSFPMDPGTIRKHQVDFFAIAGFPGVVGAIDGTHVRIIAPSEHEVEYVNRKNFHSINVQIVCDASYKILDIVASWPGATHDARILRESGLFQLFQRRLLPVKCHLLGDSGYPGKDWLLTPFLNPQAGPQSRYNRSHKCTRTLVERTIGHLKRRFHVLHGEIRQHPQRASNVIIACGVLHNIAKMFNLPLPDDDDNADAYNDNGNANDHIVADIQGTDGRAYRNHIVSAHFM